MAEVREFIKVWESKKGRYIDGTYAQREAWDIWQTVAAKYEAKLHNCMRHSEAQGKVIKRLEGEKAELRETLRILREKYDRKMEN